MKSKQSSFLLVLLVGLLLGGGLVWILFTGAQDPLADEARHLSAPASDDDAERPEPTAANLVGQDAGPAVEASFGRTELDARGQEVGTRLPAATVLVQGPTGAPIADALVDSSGCDSRTLALHYEGAGRRDLLGPHAVAAAREAVPHFDDGGGDGLRRRVDHNLRDRAEHSMGLIRVELHEAVANPVGRHEEAVHNSMDDRRQPTAGND